MNKKISNKNILIILLIVILASILIGIIISSQGKENTHKITFQNSGNVASENMKPINTAFDMGNTLQQVKENDITKLIPVEDKKANELVNLRNYEGLEKRVATYVDDNEFTEIWLFKISKEADAIDLFRILSERVAGLLNTYDRNEKIKQIIEDDNNIIMKQQSGVVIVIISNNAQNIEKTIDKEF